ncbi:hypothetical protein C8J56DRAFT_968767 [Mycena floridula]|nr:hypothetical protein C8J56DRAFT_968767 [Mycena floridula]
MRLRSFHFGLTHRNDPWTVQTAAPFTEIKGFYEASHDDGGVRGTARAGPDFCIRRSSYFVGSYFDSFAPCATIVVRSHKMVSFSLCLAVSLGFAAQALAVVTRTGSTVILTDTTAKFAGPECITFRNNGEIVEAACVDSAVDRQITPATNSAGAAVLLVERSFGAAQAPSLV